MNDANAIDRLEAEIKHFAVQCERFFTGDLGLPPENLRAELEQRLRRLRERPALGAADRFRLSGLEARFNTFAGRFARRLRAMEEGRDLQRPVPSRSAGDGRPDDAGIVVGERPDSLAVAALFEDLVRRSPKPPKFDLDSFGGYLGRQAEAIRRKTGCSQIQFRIAVEDGQAKLKARPVELTPASSDTPRSPQKGQTR